jgi:3-hydroxyisobutyrate dehydrogenase-like beta-hydroxyacid dehydrogenase
MRAGVIGLGMIGGGVAVSLVKGGRVPAAVYDVRPEAAEGLAGVPAPVGSPAAVAASSDVVLVAVVDEAQARSVLSGPEGVLSAAHADLIVVLLSTVSVSAVRALGSLCAEHGVPLLDAGVTGGTVAAENGLVVMVGGPDEAVERARPVLEDFSRAVVHCGGPGTGMAAKLARNLVTYAQWTAVREAAGLAAAAGVPLKALVRVLDKSADDSTSPLLLLKLLAGGVSLGDTEGFERLAQKDLAGAQHLAAELGLETPVADVARSRMKAVYSGELDQPMPADRRERGLAMMDRTYGEGFSTLVPENTPVPSMNFTVEQLFGEIWARPFLNLRDRRLLTLGVTAMLGRGDLLEVQLRGALANGELTVEQLRELVLHLHPYVGWGNGTTLQSVVEKIIHQLEKEST